MGEFDSSQLDSMDASEFQEVLTELIKRMGFTADHAKKAWNGGIDFITHTDKPIGAGKYIIQCKRHSTPIEEVAVHKLYEVMTSERADRGVLVTNSTFTTAALSFAEGKPIELMDGTKLIQLLNEHLPKNYPPEKRSLSINQEAILRKLVARIEKHRAQYSDIKKGLIYEKGKHVFDFPQFFTLATKHLTEQEVLLSTLESVMTSLSVVVSQSTEKMDETEVKSVLDKLDNVLAQFVEHCQIASSLRVGEGLTTIRGYFVELDAFPLEEFWRWHDSINAVLHDPVNFAKDGVIDLVYRVDGAKGSLLIQRYKREVDRFLKQEANPRKQRSKSAKQSSRPSFITSDFAAPYGPVWGANAPSACIGSESIEGHTLKKIGNRIAKKVAIVSLTTLWAIKTASSKVLSFCWSAIKVIFVTASAICAIYVLFLNAIGVGKKDR